MTSTSSSFLDLDSQNPVAKCTLFPERSTRHTGWGTIVVVLMMVVLGVPASAQTPPKVVFVDFTEALQTVAEVKAQIAVIEQFIDSKNQESDKRIDAINQLREQLNQGGGTDPESVSKQLERLETEFNRFQEDTQAEISTRRDALFRAHSDKLQKVIDEFAREGNYQIIFPIDSEVAYMDESLILTSQIVARYDLKYPLP